MMREKIVMSSRVRLARNYEDLPFVTVQTPEVAAGCINRTLQAFRGVPGAERFELKRPGEISESQLMGMVESRLVTADFAEARAVTAVLVRAEDLTSVMMNEEDHLRIQAIRRGLDLQDAAKACYAIDDALSRKVTFAFDSHLGYLTACPTNTGTGMRASLLVHLPMLTRAKQMGNVGQLVSKMGLNIRGVYGEGSEALGHVYQISNQVTLGRTEEELISAVTVLGEKLCEMEENMRQRLATGNRITMEDLAWRAWGILTHARVMPLREFYQHWSSLRLGAAMGVLNLPLHVVDDMLEQAQEGHLALYADEPLMPQSMDECRATRIRELILNAGEDL